MYRKKPQQFRSWNATALNLKTPEEPDKINDSLIQRPRRESWSQSQRGRSVRGRGVWTLDNRHHDRPNVYRRHTMPNSNSKDDYQDRNCNYRTDDESNKCNQWEEDNPIAEEPRNSSTSSGSDCDYTKENIREKCEYQNHKENFSRVRKYSTDNIYRPPKSRSASYASSDDGSHTKYEPKSINNNEPDQVWTHDKYESLESDQSDQKDTKNAKNATAPVSPLNINNELNNNNTQEVSTCEFSQKINKSESPKEQQKTIINSEHPHVITINIRDLTAKGTNEELKTEVVDLEVASEVPKVTPNINPEINPIVTPEVTEISSEVEANPNVNPESDSKVNHEVISETNIEVTPVEVLPLINLDEDDNTGTQSIEAKVSEDIFAVDWDSYQKSVMEQELKRNLERQTIQTPNLRKLDTELMVFDSLIHSSMRRIQTFRTTVWDPLLIISQIIALQTLYYTSISIITLFTLLITGTDITLDHLLDYREFRADTVLGWTIGFAWIANSVVGIFILVRLIQRARLVLDFSLTLHFFHLLITTYYSGHVPTTFIWWALNVTTCCIMIFGGEIYCMRKEMEPIPLSDDIGEGASGASGSSIAVKTKTSADVERDRYEMVPMEEIEVGG
ncbi:unnamed protein product [Rhizophagus irregularis]|nr:unnamed protein product [Rhizophagus irregularis]CAB5375620.1 unnamed protein product [Rhizophagus irregularis]